MEYKLFQAVLIYIQSLGKILRRRIDWFMVASKVGRSVQIEYDSEFIGANVYIGDGTVVSGCSLINSRDGEILIGKNCRIRRAVQLYTWLGKITIGSNCTINQNVVMLGTGGISIGDKVMIAANSVLVANSHNMLRTDVAIQDQGYSAKGIVIGDDVWIGANVTILDGVCVERGAIIGAGSVVNKNIPEYALAVGVPAKVVKMRTI